MKKTKRNKIKTDSRFFALVHGELWSPGQMVNWQTKNAFAFLNGWGQWGWGGAGNETVIFCDRRKLHEISNVNTHK